MLEVQRCHTADPPPPTAARLFLFEGLADIDDQGLYPGQRFTIDSFVCVLFYGF